MKPTALRREPTEAAFARQVVDYARLMGWRVAAFGAARTAKGWRTPCRADAQGWPDLFLCRGLRLVAAELKVGRREPTLEQVAWLSALRLAGCECYVWRPSSWDEIERTLARVAGWEG